MRDKVGYHEFQISFLLLHIAGEMIKKTKKKKLSDTPTLAPRRDTFTQTLPIQQHFTYQDNHENKQKRSN